jgi:hypothetical protein
MNELGVGRTVGKRMLAALFDAEGTLFTNPMGKGLTRCTFSYGRRLETAACASIVCERRMPR